jgi:LuxR family transcriptional regulator, maltose regulon positive regulatory protein
MLSPMAGTDMASAPTPGFDPTAWFGPTFFLEEAKLHPPPQRPGTVNRVKLLDRVHRSADVPVVSVVAPAGYGKSAVLRQWADQSPHRVAWLSIEREDNDPAVLLAYIAAALDRLGPIHTSVLRTRASPGTSVAVIVARRVAATLSTLAGPVALVLDHTEQLDNPQCRDAIAELALRLPPDTRLVVVSRDPPLPLASLRVRGAVLEVGPDDLQMEEAEARQLLQAAGVELADDELTELVRRTEGWPVGIYLAGLAMLAGGRLVGGVAFTGDDRLMADYLRSELLSHVPRGRVSFLTRTSVLERMCGSLCDAVLGRTRSGPLLEVLESANLLLVPLDRRREWYRYHKLFQELLRAELDRRESEMVGRLHERAAAWCEANGLPDMAIDHAQAAGDADRVARLVARHLLAAYAGGASRRWCAGSGGSRSGISSSATRRSPSSGPRC